jgi:hypothetical protein
MDRWVGPLPPSRASRILARYSRSPCASAPRGFAQAEALETPLGQKSFGRLEQRLSQCTMLVTLYLDCASAHCPVGASDLLNSTVLSWFEAQLMGYPAARTNT